MDRRVVSMLSMTNFEYITVEKDSGHALALCTCITSACPGVSVNVESN
jgi:hypothetical protein